MIGVRFNSLMDGSGAVGEPDQDANSALTELDKGLRSGKVGEQCEAIVRFPRLFEKYPFPILINSSFLKLGDVFRVGNNFLRLWVLRVCQQSEKHLDKILNVDELVRRVFSVLHSNDPVARALALRTLGAVAGIVHDKRRVQHAIRSALDSHDSVEVDAAIDATMQFAAYSNSFAVSMCNKLSDSVECEATPAERRARLVRALRCVHGGAVRAHGVLRLLHSLLARFPSATSARAAVAAVAAIADDTVVHVPEQVGFLLSVAARETRAGVRRAALCGLSRLSRHAALWPERCIRELVRLATGDTHHRLICLRIVQELVWCAGVCGAEGGRELLALCRDASLATDTRVAAAAASALTAIVCYSFQEGITVEGSHEVMPALESLLIKTGLESGKDSIRSLRITLRCMVKLCGADPRQTERATRALGSQLRACLWTGYTRGRDTRQEWERAEALLEALCAVGGGAGQRTLAPAMPALLHKLQTMIEIVDNTQNADDVEEQSGTAIVHLCTALCQERAGCAPGGDWERKVTRALQLSSGWTEYRVARQALRYGHNGLATRLLEGLVSRAPSEAAQRWLACLRRAAAADLLLQQGIGGAEACAAGWERSAGAGGWSAEGGGACAAGCAGCGACVSLSGAWLSARAGWLACLARTAAAAATLCTQPPPAIAHAHAQAARDPAARAGACAGALRRARTAALACANKYAQIVRTAFHADDATLRHLHIQQHTCEQLAQILERITTANYQERKDATPGAAGVQWTPASLEERLQLQPCGKMRDIADKLFNSPDTKPGITHRHAEAVSACVRACLAGAVWPRAVLAGGAAAARCRVSLSPAAPALEHAATLPPHHHLALSIEGVLLNDNRKGKPRRQVKGVQLTVTTTPHPKTDKGAGDWTATQTVTPVRDFFSAQQLVSVSSAGVYTVSVEAALVDREGHVWRTGPRTNTLIKAHEDPSTKSNAQNTRRF